MFKRVLYLGGIVVVLLLIVSLFVKDGKSDQQHSTVKKEKKVEAQVSRAQLDAILAKDLALTSSLFIQQLRHQLEKWADAELSDRSVYEKLAKEVKEHPHFYGAALVKYHQVIFSTEQFNKNQINRLDFTSKDQSTTILYSDPYLNNNHPYMMMAYPKGNDEWLVGEVDLGFIKRFVGNMAAISDANGHFFVGGKQPVVKVKDKQEKTEGNEAEVPEVGWTVLVQSKGKEHEQIKDHYRQGEILIRFVNDTQAKQWLDNHPEFTIIKHIHHDIYVLRHPHQSTQELVQTLKNDPQVIRVEPNTIFTKQELVRKKLPNDEFFKDYQWNLSQISALEGWRISEGRKDLVIAVLDTGIDTQHQDLADKIVDGYNAIDDTSNVDDEHGHGTHVAGIASAITNNLSGIAGLSWQNRIMPVKVLNHEGEGGLYEVINGIYWATDHGADVINLSLGDEEHSDLLYEAVRYAYEHDVVLVAASGNDNVDVPMYPAAYPEVLAVAAVNHLNEKTSFSNYGDYIDVTAPGEHIPGTFTNNQYVFMSGTSMAAPHVTGLVALIRSRYPDLSNQEVMDLIRQTADDLGEPGPDPYYGYGLINVYRALNHLAQGKPVQPLNSRAPDRILSEQKKQPGPLAELRHWLGQLFDHTH
jgi:subtilisin family serine protease